MSFSLPWAKQISYQTVWNRDGLKFYCVNFFVAIVQYSLKNQNNSAKHCQPEK